MNHTIEVEQASIKARALITVSVVGPADSNGVAIWRDHPVKNRNTAKFTTGEKQRMRVNLVKTREKTKDEPGTSSP